MARRFTPVEAPAVTPPRYGLLATVSALQGAEAGPRWQGGIEFEPLCPASGRRDPCGGDAMEIPDGTAIVQAVPFEVWAGDKCGTFGYAERDLAARQERARTALVATRSFQIERELWAGEVAQAGDGDGPYPNLRLADGAAALEVNPGSPLDPAPALACLEQQAAEQGSGRRVMIHARPQLVSAWHEAGLLRFEGGLIVTALDSVVVAGAGYPATDLNGNDVPASQWAVATGLVTVRLGEVKVFPRPLEQALDAVSARQNDLEVRAIQEAVATWDGCVHTAVEVDLAPCEVGS